MSKQKPEKRIQVNHQYTYITDLNVKVGDKVVVPTAYWLRDVKGPEWTVTVTSLTSDYDGECSRVIRKA